MTSRRYILASLAYHRRVHFSVAAGVAVATAVITGALLVGDSVRGSLRDLALERLGRIDSVVIAQQPFRAALAEELANSNAVQKHFDGVAPLILLPGTLTVAEQGRSRRATQLSIIGCTPAFWQFDSGVTPLPLANDEIAITKSVADELRVSVGDEVLMRVPLAGNMPAESLLGEKNDATAARRLKIAAVLPEEGLARFSLRPTQQAPSNVFVALPTLQRMLDWQSRANLLVIGRTNTDRPADALRAALQPTLDDYNIRVEQVESASSDDAGYVRITAGRLVLPPALVEQVDQAFSQTEIQRAITYLANTIKIGDRQIPYSIVTGVESIEPIGPLLDTNNQPILLTNDEVALNQWAAEDLNAKIGDQVVITFYQPETTHGVLREGEPLRLRLRAIVPLVDEAGRATRAGDPRLTPDLPGVTDQRSISDWDLPFKLVEPIRRQDEDYWKKYSTTPKAFVSYRIAQRLWKTRWGSVSLLRLPASVGLGVDEIRAKVRPSPEEMGMALIPVKRQALASARGTTSFEGLFLGFSFFLMASAVMLIALLFRLGVDRRVEELGLLSSIGWSIGRVRQVWLAEAAVVAVVGAGVGVVGGVAYARLMVHGLTTWWVAATVSPFLTLHWTTKSLAIGFAIGATVALSTIVWSLKKLLKIPARQLLAGDATNLAERPPGDGDRLRWLPHTLLAIAVGLAVFALQLHGEAQAGAFLGSGALVLGALLLSLSTRLREPARSVSVGLSLAGLAMRNARRNPRRTVLSVGLAASASFLIVALSAFRLAPTDQGTGGFDILATADQPIHFDLNSSKGRQELGFDDRENQRLAGIEVQSFRVHAGEDASCLNLYQTSQPRVLGVPKEFFDTSQFAWTTTKKKALQLLKSTRDVDSTGRKVVPVVLDKNTAIYSLHLSGVGSRFTIEDARQKPITLEVVGLLAGSVLQGEVLMGETDFLKFFPDSAGYQFFLIRDSKEKVSTDELITLLESRLEDYGVDAVATRARLAGFLAVQNTYLSTFQSLGALGLLFGTFGLAVAQLRGIVERRGELALLRSAGFGRQRLAQLVLGENLVLLLGGLGIGCSAALVAVGPHWWLADAGTPWWTLAILLAVVAIAGIAAGGLAVRAAMIVPIVPALRGE